MPERVPHPQDVPWLTTARVLVFVAVIAASHALTLWSGPEARSAAEYSVVKESSLQVAGFERATAMPSSAGASAPEATPARMLAAILPLEQELWFFKLMGPVAAVDAVTEPFEEVLRSVRLDGDRPMWTVPPGWTARGPSPMREETLLAPAAPGEKPLELSISRLGRQGDLDEALLANINRWRGQLTLPPVDLERLREETQQIDSAAGKLWFVNLAGLDTTGGRPMGMMAPFARGAAGGDTPQGGPTTAGPAASAPPASASDAPQATADVPVWTVPEGWQPGRLNAFRKAAFEVTAGATKVEITLSDLSRAGGGERLPNVNRWRGQIGLPPIDEATLARELRKLPVGSLSADYIVLESPDASADRILGVMLDRGDRTWFVKLQGDAELSRREQARFEEFVQSLKFSGS